MKTWTVMTDSDAVAWRDRVAAKYPLVSAHKILRLSLRYGLRSMALHPDLLIEEAVGSPEPKPSSAK
jgi:hypothetical protein